MPRARKPVAFFINLILYTYKGARQEATGFLSFCIKRQSVTVVVVVYGDTLVTLIIINSSQQQFSV